MQNLKDMCDSLAYERKVVDVEKAAVDESKDEIARDNHVSPDADNQQLFDDWFLEVVQPTNDE